MKSSKFAEIINQVNKHLHTYYNAVNWLLVFKIYLVSVTALITGMLVFDVMITYNAICNGEAWELNRKATLMAYAFGYAGMAVLLGSFYPLLTARILGGLKKVTFWTALDIAFIIAVFLLQLNGSMRAIINNLELQEYLDYGEEPNPDYLIEISEDEQRRIMSSFRRGDFCRLWNWPL